MCLPRALCKLFPLSYYNISRFIASSEGPVSISEMTPMGFSFRWSNGLCTYRPQLAVVGNHAVAIRTFGGLVRIRDSEIPRSYYINIESFRRLARGVKMTILDAYCGGILSGWAQFPTRRYIQVGLLWQLYALPIHPQLYH